MNHEPMTDEQRAARVASLRVEREGYVRRALTDRVAQVDAQIALYSPATQARAERRPRSTPKRETR